MFDIILTEEKLKEARQKKESSIQFADITLEFSRTHDKLLLRLDQYVLEYPNDNLKRVIIEIIQHLNQVSADSKLFHEPVIQKVIQQGSDIRIGQSKATYKEDFLAYFRIREADLSTFKLRSLDVDDIYISQIIDAYLLRIIALLKHNNGSVANDGGSGRHISPGVVAITSTISVNLVCDAVDGSYQADLEKSKQAQHGHILYSFTPEVTLVISLYRYLLILFIYDVIILCCHGYISDLQTKMDTCLIYVKIFDDKFICVILRSPDLSPGP